MMIEAMWLHVHSHIRPFKSLFAHTEPEYKIIIVIAPVTMTTLQPPLPALFACCVPATITFYLFLTGLPSDITLLPLGGQLSTLGVYFLAYYVSLVTPILFVQFSSNKNVSFLQHCLKQNSILCNIAKKVIFPYYC